MPMARCFAFLLLSTMTTTRWVAANEYTDGLTKNGVDVSLFGLTSFGFEAGGSFALELSVDIRGLQLGESSHGAVGWLLVTPL